MVAVFSLKWFAVLCVFVHGITAVSTEGYSTDSGGYEPKLVQDGLDPGVIAGVGVAGGIIIIALILLAIYCCVRARNVESKDPPESSVYTSGTSQAIFPPGNARKSRGKYGSMEDIKSTTSSKEQANGAYANPAYSKEPGEKQYDRQASVGRARGKAGFANDAYDAEDGTPAEQVNNSWEEKEIGVGRNRMSRKEASERGSAKPMKSALKKPAEIEMGQVSTQPNGILKTRTHSPNRSQTSSTDASLDANAMIYGYTHLGKEQPNIIHKPVIERRRSRSNTRSHRSGSSGGHSRRSKSPDKSKIKTSRMYGEVFIDDRSHRSRSSGSRTRSGSSRRTRSERTSDSLDSGSSTTSQSRKVSMNPGGKRVHIKGEETDI